MTWDVFGALYGIVEHRNGLRDLAVPPGIHSDAEVLNSFANSGPRPRKSLARTVELVPMPLNCARRDPIEMEPEPPTIRARISDHVTEPEPGNG